jgi:hypothetical protein
VTEPAPAPFLSPAAYPVLLEIEPCLENRNRLTVAFRIILAIPHLLLVGGPGIGFVFGSWGVARGGSGIFNAGSAGVLGAVAGVCAFIAWFAIVFTGAHPRGLWDLTYYYMRWHTRASAYISLFRDEYPPFGDGDYPVRFEISYPENPRDRLSVGLRIIYAIPHILLLFFLGFAWFLTTVCAWFAILFTGNYPAGLYDFGFKVWRWQVRVEAYLFLMRDEYPPFSLQA